MNNKKHRILDIQTSEDEYDLLVSMLTCFKRLGGDAVKSSFSAWKGMHDECTDFSYKQNESNKELCKFIEDLTADDSVLRISDSREALHHGVLLVLYCLDKGDDKHGVLLARYIENMAHTRGYADIVEEVNLQLEYLN